MRQNKENSQNRRSWLAKKMLRRHHTQSGVEFCGEGMNSKYLQNFFWGETDELHQRERTEEDLVKGELRQGGSRYLGHRVLWGAIWDCPSPIKFFFA